MLSPLLRAAWEYRAFVRSSIANEFRAKVARSRLGAAWVVLQPLAQVIIFTTVLSGVLAARLPGTDNRYAFTVYLLAGMLCWNFFAEIVQRCVTVFIDQAHLLRKVQFPRIALPLVVVGSAMVANIVLLAVMLLVLPMLGFYPALAWLWLPALILLTAALAAGIGLLLGTLNVFSRDIGQVVGVAMQFWFWATPIVYPVSILPEKFKVVLLFNPVAPLVAGYQNVIVHGQAPSGGLWMTVSFAAITLVLALVVFRRASPELVDAL